MCCPTALSLLCAWRDVPETNLFQHDSSQNITVIILAPNFGTTGTAVLEPDPPNPMIGLKTIVHKNITWIGTNIGLDSLDPVQCIIH